ncbi:MAG: stage V sporulation protein AD [Lachnoclostridium sp.]|nr:stage V sporulation protein AD [Lachnospira sp.]MCM1247476.1 stage V sporulation protein AD [Lachnoclostridium sp.]MCM1568431.1 stage V sporulation protein AD [Roseburia sp.]
MNQKAGRASIKLENSVYILNSASIVGKKEGEGPLGLLFDMIGEDDLFGCNSWEEAESSLQKDAVYLALSKAGVSAEDISFIYAGDLLGQSIATSFGISSYNIPLFGVYGACSTCGESLALGAMTIAGGYADKVVCVTSSHFASAEKEFRFPLEYGNQRPLSATWTVTGSGAFVLGNQPLEGSGARARIVGMTVGKIVDYGLKDSMNMGACMAPAAASTLEQHFIDFGSQPENYDKIITGDLGSVGQKVLIDLLRKKGYDISAQHMDCGIEIFDAQAQDTHAGGSGCGCSAVTLSAYILKQLEEGNWKKVLFMPTGALLSKTSFNEGKSVPGIAHALVLEKC